MNGRAINRDPRYWPQAERFYPERFIDSSIDYNGTYFEFIPFGAGRRICPGITFAIANIELPLAQLLYHFDWMLPNGTKKEELDMTEAYGVTPLAWDAASVKGAAIGGGFVAGARTKGSLTAAGIWIRRRHGRRLDLNCTARWPEALQ
ncbi:hypothetical protein RJ640_005290 [Escallonia rubra]|uniref:Cytochrome P450 n=1 Tax=Escallonia rubra TaxID=112253 RepID=A0AA88QBW5_9ASTE|nr:hypothetical protein RJ640_005290 [Escallonia rubra]